MRIRTGCCPISSSGSSAFSESCPGNPCSTVSYAGNHMLNGLEHGLNLNQLVDSQRSNDATVTNPFYGVLAVGQALWAGAKLPPID